MGQAAGATEALMVLTARALTMGQAAVSTEALTVGQGGVLSEPMGHVNWSLDGGSSGSVWVGFGPYG